MTDNTPTANQRLLLDVIGNVPTAWDLEVTYPTLPEVTHRFDSLPELVFTTTDGAQGHEIAVRASITADKVFHGYVVTTTYPEPGVLTATCRERCLTSLSHRELLSEDIGVRHQPDLHPASDAAVAQSLSLSAAASLAGYYAATIDPDAAGAEDAATKAVTTADD